MTEKQFQELEAIHSETRWKKIGHLLWRVHMGTDGFYGVIMDKWDAILWSKRFIGRDRAEDATIAKCHEMVGFAHKNSFEE